MKSRSRMYTVKEFVDWFKRQVESEMDCRDVDVESAAAYAGGALVIFMCGGKKYLAKIRNGRRFRVSVYGYIYKNGKLVGIKKLKLHEPLKVFDNRLGINSDNALFYVEDDVVIDVYEAQPRGGLLEPRNY